MMPRHIVIILSIDKFIEDSKVILKSDTNMAVPTIQYIIRNTFDQPGIKLGLVCI